MSGSPAHTRQLMGVEILTARHPALQRLRRQTGPATHHGHKLWGSSLVLMDYLSEFSLPQGARTLELGCGWGALSLGGGGRGVAAAPGSRTGRGTPTATLSTRTTRSPRCTPR